MSARVRIALVGAGRIGSHHAEAIALRVPQAELVAVADPMPGAAERLAGRFGDSWIRATTDVADVLAADDVDGIVITSIARAHTDLIVAAAAAGKPIFCEKPMALTLADADRALAAVKDAGVSLQIGFNRRFAAGFAEARQVVADGGIGDVQLLRSLTRDPGLANPGGVPPWTVFRETLIHDFDTLLWFAAARGARPVQVYAVADALVAPDYKDSGLLDTAVVTIRFDNGAIATAEANFSAAYGYDVRGEVFGSAGMVTAGEHAATSMRHYTSAGVAQQTVRGDTALFGAAYTAELAHFANSVAASTTPQVGGQDARNALAVALACIVSVQEDRPVGLSEVEGREVVA